jgi:hypothetical protein
VLKLSARFRAAASPTGGARSSTLAVVDASDLTCRDEAPELAVEIIELVLPAGTGYTLRTYGGPAGAADRAAFLSRDGQLLLFRGLAGLADFLATDHDHDLAASPGWTERVAGIVSAALVEAADEPDGTATDSDASVARYEFDLVPANLRGSPDQWIPELLLPARNVMVELATALESRRIRAALAEGEYLDRFDDALRAAASAGSFSLARRRLRAFDPARLASQWRQIIRWLEQTVRWAD